LNKFKIIISLGILFTIGLQYDLAYCMPAQVLIIRHAEKPATGPDLSDRGYLRAEKLVGLFTNDLRFQDFGKIAAIFAMAPSSSSGSKRAIQTVQPLSKALNLVVNTTFTKLQISELVSEISNAQEYSGKTVLICWEHNVILNIAEAFGLVNPPDWPSSIFDRVWKLEPSTSKFENLPQKLLDGDDQL
jgi:hypothetical protein